MLQIIRDKTTGWIATAIVVLLIIPFAFWGINYYFTGGKEPFVATVNGEEIKYNWFQRTFSNYRVQMQNMMGKALGPGEDELLKQQILDKMVESELLNQVTRSAGLRVSNEQVKQSIKALDVFKDQDGFNREFYQRSVLQLGMSPARYEEQMRLDMMSEQLQGAIIESEFATNYEVQEATDLTHQRRDFTYTLIPAERFRENIEVSDADIGKFYEENSRLYIRPEQVKIAYIELNIDNLSQSADVNEDDLRAYYETNKSKYIVEEQRKITQILIKTDDENSSEEKLAIAESKAEKILGEIHDGKSFEDIASEYAEDKSGEFGITEYGYLGKGILQPAVDEVAFDMQIGDMSEIIKSDLGFHIIKLIDIKGGVKNTFENSREKAEKDYRKELAEQSFFELADQMATLAFEHPDTLEIAAEETGLAIQQTEFFSRNGTGEGITANPMILSASFSEDVLSNHHNSDVIELTNRHLVVLRVVEHLAQAKRPLEEVREEIIRDIKFQQASRQAHDLGQDIIKDLQAGKDITEIATDKNIQWDNAESVSRDDVSVNRSVLRTAFSLGVPLDDTPVIEGVSLGSGDYAVIMVQKVTDPALESIKDEEMEKIRFKVYSTHAASSWYQYLDALKADAEIQLFKDRLE